MSSQVTWPVFFIRVQHILCSFSCHLPSALQISALAEREEEQTEGDVLHCPFPCAPATQQFSLAHVFWLRESIQVMMPVLHLNTS